MHCLSLVTWSMPHDKATDEAIKVKCSAEASMHRILNAVNAVSVIQGCVEDDNPGELCKGYYS